MEQDPSSDREQRQTSKQAENVPMPQSQPTPQDTESISRDAIKAKQEEFEESIKRGERWMIYLTAAIALFAFGSVIVGYFQWRVMSGQLTEMKNSSTDTHDLAQAAKDQASNTEKLADAAIKQVQELKASVKAANTQSELAQEANRISSSGIERGQRPWVAVGGIRIFNKPTEGEPMKINAKVANGGKTPGVHALVYHAFKLLITTDEYLSTHIPLRNEPEIEKCAQPKPKWTNALGGAIGFARNYNCKLRR